MNVTIGEGKLEGSDGGHLGGDLSISERRWGRLEPKRLQLLLLLRLRLRLL